MYRVVYRGVVRDQKVSLLPCSLLEHVIGDIQCNSDFIHIVPTIEYQPNTIPVRIVSEFGRRDLIEQGNYFR